MPVPSLAGGVLADRYELIEEIGRGGAAVVYRARDVKHDRDVAVKVLHDELTQSMSADRFAREIDIASKLTHPHILPLYDSGESGGRFYYVAPFIEGESLRDRLAREGQLPLRDAIAIAKAVAGALECAHSHGVVHRDIKPENILLASGQPLVSDFGIARGLQSQMKERLTATGLVIGTPAYMSPEQAGGEEQIDARSDIYSLGCVLYEMLAGYPPFRGATVQAMIASRFTSEVPDVRIVRDSVPDSLAEVVEGMLARLPADRIQSGAELVEALTEAEGEIASLTGSTRERRSRTFRRRIAKGAGWRRYAVAVAFLAVAGAAAGVVTNYLSRRDAAQVPRVQTIAVLPLANLSGDVQQEFVADGLTEALITDLSRLPGVRVIARTSVMQYKMMRKPIREIARELNADALIEGALMRQGDMYRITAKLVRGSDDQNLWTASYDGRAEQLLDLQREVGLAVAREIGARFRPGAGTPTTAKPESQEAYLKGVAYAGQWRLEEAIASFQRAVEVDPTNAPAYASLARAFYFRTFFGEVAPLEAFSQMRRAAAAAIGQDPTLGEAYGLMALVNTHFDYDWGAAEENFRRALELSPSNAQVHHDYAHFLLAMGRRPESVTQSQRSVRLDPANAMLTACLGWHSLFDEQYDQALAHAGEAQKMMPSYWAQIVQGWAQASKGMHAEAIESMEDAAALAPELAFATAAYAQALAWGGRKDSSRKILDGMLVQASKGYVSAYDIALVYASLEDSDRAFEWLAKALAERSMFVVHLAWDARLGALRKDPRLADVVQRLGIPAGRMRGGPAAGRA
jgi:eukaryotic-like serine/threonine-protein kinase